MFFYIFNVFDFKRIFFNVSASAQGGVVVSTALDGSDAFIVRNDTASGDLARATAITYHEPADVFYWATTDGQLMMEELDHESGVFHHNELLIEGTRFTGLAVWHPASQPTPCKSRHISQGSFTSS